MAYVVITDTNFQQVVLQSKVPVLLDFWAEWCPPCKMISPLMDDLASEFNGQCVIGKINADENPQVVGQYMVMSLPTVLLFKDGEPVQVLVGAKSKQTYGDEIKKLIAS